MRKAIFFLFAMVLTFAIALSSCKKDETNNNGNNNGNSENPEGGNGSGSVNHEYPPTAHVFPRAVTDIDGNCYDAVEIGNQVWMAENLRTTHYSDGTEIPLGSPNNYTDPITSYTSPYRYYPNGFSYNVSSYGYLYNRPAVMHGQETSDSNPSGIQGICPTGWHIPSMAEWNQLLNSVVNEPAYLLPGNDGYHYLQGSIGKALSATWGWDTAYTSYWYGNNYDYMQEYASGCVGYNVHLNNATGFSAVGAGTGYELGRYAYFWSTNVDIITNPYGVIDTVARQLYFSAYQIFDLDKHSDNKGYDHWGTYSVRCVRD